MRSNRHRMGTQRLPKLIFTVDDLTFLKHALVPLQQLIGTKPQSLPKIQFALETVLQVEAKLSQIMQEKAWGYKIALDVNEIIILHTALWLFLAALQEIPDSPERQQSLGICLALQSQLASIVAIAVRK